MGALASSVLHGLSLGQQAQQASEAQQMNLLMMLRHQAEQEATQHLNASEFDGYLPPPQPVNVPTPMGESGGAMSMGGPIVPVDPHADLRKQFASAPPDAQSGILHGFRQARVKNETNAFEQALKQQQFQDDMAYIRSAERTLGASPEHDNLDMFPEIMAKRKKWGLPLVSQERAAALMQQAYPTANPNIVRGAAGLRTLGIPAPLPTVSVTGIPRPTGGSETERAVRTLAEQGDWNTISDFASEVDPMTGNPTNRAVVARGTLASAGKDATEALLQSSYRKAIDEFHARWGDEAPKSSPEYKKAAAAAEALRVYYDAAQTADPTPPGSTSTRSGQPAAAQPPSPKFSQPELPQPKTPEDAAAQAWKELGPWADRAAWKARVKQLMGGSQ